MYINGKGEGLPSDAYNISRGARAISAEPIKKTTMSEENTNNHVKFLSKACLVLGIPAAILAAFRISYGAFYSRYLCFST